ncbi:MAG: hypothetical protein ABI646_08060 [Acidobacteriota bacterium]
MPRGLSFLQWSDPNELEIAAEWPTPQARAVVTTVGNPDAPLPT